jgi:hypothetical protein
MYAKPDAKDISHAWFVEKDYTGFKKKCKVLSRLGKEIGPDAVEVYCNESCRGLEHLMCPTTLTLRKRRRELAWVAVLDEQHQQRDSERGCWDTEKVAIVYRLISNDALADAHRRALADANEVAAFSNFSMSDSEDAVVEITEESCEGTAEQAACLTLKRLNGLIQGALVAPSQSVPCVMPRRNWQLQS